MPVVLAGTKLDMRDDQRTLEALKLTDLSSVSYQQGVQMAEGIGATEYIECSAYTRVNVHELFLAAIRAALAAKRVGTKKKAACLLLYHSCALFDSTLFCTT